MTAQTYMMKNSWKSRHVRIQGILLALGLLWPSFAHAQGTLIPFVSLYFNDASGNPVNNGKLCVYAAGSSTPISTYSDVTLMTANANPIRTSSNGRPTTGAIFLSPGVSYKFILLTAGADNTCSTGTTLWTLDNVSAVPTSSGNVDITGTAGEALAAGDVVYMSSGVGGTIAGRWYKADADATYASSTAVSVGIAPVAVASAGLSGTIRLIGKVTGLSGLSAGSNYYASATAGGLTATQPTNARLIGAADSTTSLVMGERLVPAPRGPPNGRLTLESGVCVSSTDQTAKTMLFYTPCGGGNALDLYDGSQWVSYAFTEVSIAVPATTVTMYDVFAYANAGIVTLELTAWTNDTTRATALTKQNGVLVKTGALTRRYLGSFRTTGVSGQTEDSLAKRYVWNYYHRVRRSLYVTDSTATWNYTTATVRQANANTANQLDVVIGVAEVSIHVETRIGVANTNAAVNVQTLIGEDSTTAAATNSVTGYWVTQSANNIHHISAILMKMPAVGRHVYVWLELSAATGTTTWQGSNIGSAIVGSIEG